MSLTARIKSEAQKLGFAHVGILPAGPSQTHEFYTSWLAAGYAGEMAYLHRHAELKADLAKLAPWARSAILLTFNYNPPDRETPAPFSGRISRYAGGRDYHDLLKERLERLTAFIESQSADPLQSWHGADTGPVMEREFAARAGLGWVGKNGLLIHWRAGSWLFLAELLVNIELEYDRPPTSQASSRRGRRTMVLPLPPPLPGISEEQGAGAPPSTGLNLRESCGSCTACIDACPTGAIVGEKTVDSRRCISYLTIELKGPIPAPFRAQIGDWVFGCDICQEVCPWNRHAPRTMEPEFATDANAAISLPALLALGEQEFRDRFRGTALWRTKRRGLLRNAAIVLGNQLAQQKPGGVDGGEAEAALGALRKSLGDSEPVIRGAAAWALGQAGGAIAAQALDLAADGEREPTVQEEISLARAGWRE